MNDASPLNSPVLLVEDSPDDERLAVRAFKSHGIESSLVVARDGMEAIDQLNNLQGEGLAFMLLDLKLPKVSGFEVLEHVRGDKSLRFLPVVVLTTSDLESDVVGSYSRGANAFVKKPLAFAEYNDTLGKVIQFWLAINRRPTLPS